MALVAGVDCSTQATKVVVVDDETGAVVAGGRAAHEVAGRDGARETDPRQWREALAAALAETGRAGEVAAVSIAAQQHGLVVCDAAGEPLRPAILWNDTRSAREAERLVAAAGAAWWADEVGVVPVPSITVTKWAWLRDAEPGVAAAARGVCLPHDWLTGQLTGAPTTDRGDASGTGWWSPRSERYHPEVLGRPEVDLDPAVLPPVLEPDGVAGEVTAAGADRVGLPADIPVGVGTGDNMAAALGLGVGAGVPVLSLGSSGTVFAASERAPADPSGVVAGFADAVGGHLPLACTLNCTPAVDRFAEWLGLDREAAAEATDVAVLPYLDGERTPNLPDAAGVVAGLRHDTTPGEILRAAYEGAVAALLSALDGVDAHSSGLDPAVPLVLVGGGAQGRTWREVARRLSGRPLRLPTGGELVALGAAAQAAAARTGEPAREVARRWGHGRGEELAAVERDEAALARLAAAQQAARPLLTAER